MVGCIYAHYKKHSSHAHKCEEKNVPHPNLSHILLDSEANVK